MTTQEDEKWLNSRDGAELLGAQQANLIYYARIGEIKTKEEKSGHQEKVYWREDILKVRKKLTAKARSKRGKPTPTPVLIDWLMSADLPAGLRLAQQVYHADVDLAEAAAYDAWRRNNKHLTLGAFSPDRKECYASIQLVPLISEQIALDVLANRRTENSITPDEIRSYDEPGAYILLATSAIVIPDKQHNDLLYRLLARYIDYWISMYPERYISKIYAQAVSERGVLLSQHMFMSPRYDLAYNAYELNMAHPSASRIIQKLKTEMEKIAPLPSDLIWSPPVQASQQPTIISASAAPPETPKITDKPGLPDGLVAWRPFAELHNIPVSTVKKAIDDGRLSIVAGNWKHGRTTIQGALDAAGRQQFYELYATRSNFKRCEGCPHA